MLFRSICTMLRMIGFDSTTFTTLPMARNALDRKLPMARNRPEKKKPEGSVSDSGLLMT